MLLKEENQPTFQKKWLHMRPTILKLLWQESVPRYELQGDQIYLAVCFCYLSKIYLFSVAYTGQVT